MEAGRRVGSDFSEWMAEATEKGRAEISKGWLSNGNWLLDWSRQMISFTCGSWAGMNCEART